MERMKLEKIKEEKKETKTPLFFDDKGEFYFGANGTKIYTNQKLAPILKKGTPIYIKDDGKFYYDDNGVEREIEGKLFVDEKANFPKQVLEKAKNGFVKVKSSGIDDIEIITDKGEKLNLPIRKVKWEMSSDNREGLLTIEMFAELEADGCIMRKAKKAVPITKFMEQKNENDYCGE